MAKRTLRTHTREHRFLQELARTCNVRAAAQAAGVGRRTVYEWRATDQDFAARWDEAEHDAVDRLEAEAWRRAFETHDRTSGRMIEMLLRAHRPQKYRDRHEVSAQGGGFIGFQIVLTDSDQRDPRTG